jgi:hypothetical protein
MHRKNYWQILKERTLENLITGILTESVVFMQEKRK